jgi:hypothetical protein
VLSSRRSHRVKAEDERVDVMGYVRPSTPKSSFLVY